MTKGSTFAKVPEGHPRDPRDADLEAARGEPAGRFRWEKELRTRATSEGMKPSHMHVALVMATWANGDGTKVRPTKETIRTATGLGLSTIYDALKYLTQEGWMQQLSQGSGGSKMASEYRLTIPQPSEER